VFALIAILTVQLVVAALLFGTLLLDRPDEPAARTAELRRRSR
jgi:hypothetical protein